MYEKYSLFIYKNALFINYQFKTAAIFLYIDLYKQCTRTYYKDIPKHVHCL